MHDHAATIRTLYTALDQHHPEAMADCYHHNATFHDIAFTLRGQSQIRGMWRMIAATDLRATFKVIYADEETAVAELVDVYTFSETRNRVRNEIRSEFRFREGKIIEHRDLCSALSWGLQAFGFPVGLFPGVLAPLRRKLAMKKLAAFTAAHPNAARSHH